MLSNQKDREIEHLSEQTSLSHNAKDYLRFSVPFRDWRSCCFSKKSDKAESAEGRSPVRAEQIILVIEILLFLI
jgi:hypothetical protein